MNSILVLLKQELARQRDIHDLLRLSLNRYQERFPTRSREQYSQHRKLLWTKLAEIDEKLKSLLEPMTFEAAANPFRQKVNEIFQRLEEITDCLRVAKENHAKTLEEHIANGGWHASYEVK